MRHDRNENQLTAITARELGKLALGPVGPDVTLLDGKALAGGKRVDGENPVDGRTAPLTQGWGSHRHCPSPCVTIPCILYGKALVTVLNCSVENDKV